MDRIKIVCEEACFAFDNAKTSEEMEHYRQRFVSANGLMKSCLSLCDDKKNGLSLWNAAKESFDKNCERLRCENAQTN